MLGPAPFCFTTKGTPLCRPMLWLFYRFDSTKFSEGNPWENLVLSNRCFQVRKTQRFDNTKFSERKPYRTAVFSFMFGKRCGSITPNFLKGNLSENLVLSDRCLQLQVWKTQRFDSTKFSERKPFRNLGASEPLCGPFPFRL